MKKPLLCVDLDGVLADYSMGWKGIDHIGDPIPGAKAFVEELRKFARVMIYTTRCCTSASDQKNVTAFQLEQRVRAWLNKHQIYVDDVWTGQGKPLCHAFIDDRAINCVPQQDARAYQSAITKAQRMCKVEQDKGEKEIDYDKEELKLAATELAAALYKKYTIGTFSVGIGKNKLVIFELTKQPLNIKCEEYDGYPVEVIHTGPFTLGGGDADPT